MLPGCLSRGRRLYEGFTATDEKTYSRAVVVAICWTTPVQQRHPDGHWTTLGLLKSFQPEAGELVLEIVLSPGRLAADCPPAR
jgi:hypothetical protein